ATVEGSNHGDSSAGELADVDGGGEEAETLDAGTRAGAHASNASVDAEDDAHREAKTRAKR
ncbi:hypothetical protein SB912_25970, partial [Pantoea sp. SIMBA_072]